MIVNNKILNRVADALSDRVEDYYDNVHKYEGTDDYPMYWKGYGSHLALGLCIINALKEGEFEYRGEGVYEFPFDWSDVTEKESMDYLPDQLTWDEIDLYMHEGPFVDFETFDDLATAEQFAASLEKGLSEHETQIYTQVDSDTSDELVYLRGKHIVNRTGKYIVIWL